MDGEYHAMGAEDAVSSLGSSPKGLPPDEAVKRLQRFGPNELMRSGPYPPGARSPTKTIIQTGFLDYKKLIIAVLVSFSFQLAIVCLPGSTRPSGSRPWNGGVGDPRPNGHGRIAGERYLEGNIAEGLPVMQ